MRARGSGWIAAWLLGACSSASAPDGGGAGDLDAQPALEAGVDAALDADVAPHDASAPGDDGGSEAGADASTADAGAVPRPGCARLGASAATHLPPYSGSIPPAGDLSIGDQAQYLYVMTQWGIARAGLSAHPENPGPYNGLIVGWEGGSSSGGVIRILCDCHQGWNTIEVAEADGAASARMIGDWQPYPQGGPPPPNDPDNNFSGLPAQLVQATAAQNIRFGQQIVLPARVPLGARLAAIYAPSTQRYFGYFPVYGASAGVYLADLSTPTGVASYTAALTAQPAIGWISTSQAVRLKGARVSVPGYDHLLLVGATAAPGTLRVAEVDPTRGAPTEIASAPIGAALPAQLEVAIIDQRIFIFLAADLSGTVVFELVPPGTLRPAGTLPERSKRVLVRGPQPFPALFVHRTDNLVTTSSIAIYDTRWLATGSAPVEVGVVPHFGDPTAGRINYGFEALVRDQNGARTAYLYREKQGNFGVTPPIESSITTDVIDLSCLLP
jgi:hypothetical protein